MAAEHSAPRRRVWCEHVPLERLARADLLEALSQRGIEPLVSVFPDDASRIAALVRACRAHGVRVGLWPMLDEALGRWPGGRNAEPFAGFVTTLLDRLARESALPATLAVDLEPPVGELRRVVSGDVGAALSWIFRPETAGARATYARLSASVQARGLECIAAVVPMVLADRDGRSGFERALDTPYAGVPFDRVSPMAYASLFEGWSAGLVRRRDAEQLVAMVAARARRSLGARAAISIGLVGQGALGDEPVYRGPAELARDVSLARAAGLEDIAAYSLDGMLARPPLAAWLDALRHTPAAARLPRLGPRAALVAAGAVALSTSLCLGPRAARRAGLRR